MCLIRRLFMPDLYLDDIYGIDLGSLAESGIRAVLLDIDNTLVTYDDAVPTEAVLNWLGALKAHGITPAFISNNHKERVEKFNESLGFFASYDSHKPSGKCYRQAMAELRVTPRESCVIGDQIFTDVWSAKRLGIRAILVKPIKDKTTLFFRTKRLLEKPILRRYRRIHRSSELKGC